MDGHTSLQISIFFKIDFTAFPYFLKPDFTAFLHFYGTCRMTMKTVKNLYGTLKFRSTAIGAYVTVVYISYIHYS